MTSSDASYTDAVPRGWHLRLRTRIALFAAIAVGIAVSLTAAVVFFVVRTELYDQFDSDLLGRAKAVGQAVAGPDVVTPGLVELLGNAQIAFLRADNVLLTVPGSATPPSSAAELDVAKGVTESSLRKVTVDGESMRLATVPSGAGRALLFAVPTESVDSTLRQLELILLFVGLVGVLGAAAAGYAVARAGLRPVAELTSAAERVARTEDLTPIAVGSDDELGRLAQSFNAMLVSLDASRERERRLVADAGHELRTPLTSIRTNLDLLAQSEGSGPTLAEHERGSLLADVRAQVAELNDLIGDLVQLSRGPSAVQVNEPVDLAQVVERSLDRVRRRVPGVTVDVQSTSWWVDGDPVLLERAVTNLLDNAAKWSPPEGSISVTLSEGVLSVMDQGPGIPPGERGRVFERFYRSPSARGLPGSGLGLAIVAQTAERHGGSVLVSDSPSGGALLALRLPGTATQPQEER